MNADVTSVRQATPDDASPLVDLIDMAGEGLASYVWQGLAEPGETPRDVGLRRARRPIGAFSFANASVATLGGAVIGGLVGYRIDTEVQPIPDDLPAMFVPLQELENLAPGSWYVNALAVLPGYRGRGVGSHLLREAERRAAETGATELSIIVSNANPGAERLYEATGYLLCAERPMIKDDWENPGTAWRLLVKSLG